jgi:transcriptional regulator with XRE-family HTH domain
MEISGMTVKAYREQLQMSQRDFAEALDVSQGLISLVEIGRNPVSRKLLRRLRERSDEGILNPTFGDFLAEGGIEPSAGEAEFQIVRPIPLEPWTARIDLRKPVDAGVAGRFFVPGLPEGARAYVFNPAPRLLEQDNIAVFRPASLADLVRDQIVLVQFKVRQGTKHLPAGVAHLGRAIVVRRGRVPKCQFEPMDMDAQVVDLDGEKMEGVMACFFRGRHCR